MRERNTFEPESIYTGYAILPPQSDIAEASYTGAYNDTLILSTPVAYNLKSPRS